MDWELSEARASHAGTEEPIVGAQLIVRVVGPVLLRALPVQGRAIVDLLLSQRLMIKSELIAGRMPSQMGLPPDGSSDDS